MPLIVNSTPSPSKLRDSIKRVIWESDLIASRLTLAIGEFCWAAMLLWPGDTFGRPTYSHMAAIMSEEWWSLMFIVSCCMQLYFVLSGKLNTLLAWYFAGWNMILWGYTVWSMMASVYPPPAAIGGEIALTITSFWIWFRPLLPAGPIDAKSN